MKLRFAPAVDHLLDQFERAIPHAILLTGPVGVGLFTLAEYIAKNGTLLETVLPETATSGGLASIKTERIRDLYVATRSKLNGAHFVIIDDADTMNHVAQNALLKLLEEPNESIHFILTSHSPDKLLPTIRSRTQTFAVPRISAIESQRLIKSAGVSDSTTTQRLLYVANGLPAEIVRLVANESDFKVLAERVQKARQFAEGTTYQRLIVIQSLKDDRQGALKMIETIILLLRRSLANNPNAPTVTLIDRLLNASDAIRANGNIRLHLSGAVV